jgi:hypothetical protein
MSVLKDMSVVDDILKKTGEVINELKSSLCTEVAIKKYIYYIHRVTRKITRVAKMQNVKFGAIEFFIKLFPRCIQHRVFNTRIFEKFFKNTSLINKRKKEICEEAEKALYRIKKLEKATMLYKEAKNELSIQ